MAEQDNTPIQPQADPAAQQPMDQQFQQQQQQPANQQFQQQPIDPQAQQQWQQPYQQQPMQQPYQQQWQQTQQPYQQQQQWQQPYQQQGAYPYGQPGPAMGAPAPTPAAKSSNKALVALICGIVAIVFSSSIIVGIAAGVVAIVFALKAKKEAPDGKATAGLICGIVGVALSVIMIPVLALYIYPAAQNGWNFTSGASKSSSHKASLADTINGEVIADDAILTLKLTRMEIDDKGDLNIYFTLKNNASRSDVKLDVATKSGEAWELNGKKVEAIAFSWADGGQTKEDQCITIPGSYLDITDVDEVESISGNLVVTMGSTNHELTYPVDLYV